VFVEKPLCLTFSELDKIKEFYPSPITHHPSPHLMVGYNRRFAPLTRLLNNHFSDGPKAMIYRINAGAIPKESWIQDREFGGGRIIGEACHFIDFLTFMAGALPTHVHTAALPDPHGLNDTVSINLSFADGSIGTVCYFANGSKKLPKEYIEIHQNGVSGVLTDLKELRIHGQGKPVKKKLFSQDKGQKEMVRAFIDTIKSGGPPLIPFEQIVRVSQVTFAALDSIRTRQAFGIDTPVSPPADPTHP
jgi:polar amino acid transport system substrate-binding protein